MKHKRNLSSLLVDSVSSRAVDSLVSALPEVIVIHTPLMRAIIHLLKIGSTSQSELQEMAREFITEKDAMEKFGLVKVLKSNDPIEKRSSNISDLDHLSLD